MGNMSECSPKKDESKPADARRHEPSLKKLFFGFTDLLFNLDSRLWQTLIGLVWRPLETHRRYLAHGDADLLNPLKLITGLCALSILVWGLLPGMPSFSEVLVSVQPDIAAQLAAAVEAEGVSWAHLATALDHRMNLLNVPFILLTAIPIIGYLKLIRRDRALIEHAVFALSCFNVYLIFLIVSAPLYWLELGFVLTSLLPLLLVLLPYLLTGLWALYFSTPGRFAAAAAGLVLVGTVSYLAASNIALFTAIRWAMRSVLT